MDVEFFNEYLRFHQKHLGWVLIEEKFIDFLRDEIDILFPKNISELALILPEIKYEVGGDYPLVYDYTLNKFKDDSVWFDDSWGL